MTVSTRLSDDGSAMTIRVAGRFDFNVHRDLRQAYEGAGQRYSNYVIDLANTSYMDSSALGMLLQLRAYAGNSAQSVKIVNASPSLLQILKVANFDKLMTIA
ncbi:MAG: STAS domain-containing protein [Gammaproteobacteria bacterium]